MNVSIPKPILVPPAKIPSPIMVVPHQKQGGSIDITSARNHAALMRRVDAFFKKAPSAAKAGPINPSQFTSTSVTPMNEFGVQRTAFNVNGELWVKQQAVCPGAKPTWFDLGRVA
jgi:hypothetical protein